ncbi:hypothetical protein ASPACDRAFT_40956 [Aspergillus aculeatus ATCC 16872]|uniref:Uncharacterized protein n=1 Tax=Aspergillus aculeatus (strain ATCC 16872 / CBS 172.66 / WB 5094) TaxID=690307 RepID=A0A1L9X1W1_ASPA1|nr:uncharacterized protein ASPACDRAFT_40956 [Aspergillus aculeatus ATCC 16872]OJK02138.1 hypothetical protein ASPACDRAFT_40956 [Aspergillus aculeatus ATCC 16872]
MAFRLKVLAGTTFSSIIGIGLGLHHTTANIHAVPLTTTDPIFASKFYRSYNPNNNPTIHDLHIIRVPLSEIDPALLEDPPRLLERYCGGIWAGAGFALQRMLRKWLDKPNTDTTQLWSPSELLRSDYQVGTDIVAELEVIDQSSDSILIRGGDKTCNRGLRPLDALIEVAARVDKENNVVEFGFKSLFFQGIGRTDQLPMPGPVVWLHELYAKILLKSGVQYVLK